MPWNDHVGSHGEIVLLSPGLWQVTGSLKYQSLPRNMVIWKLASGGLWLHSVVALDEAGMTALEALGTPEVMVVPSGMHRLDAPVYKARYPDLLVICPAKARDAVAKAVAVDALVEHMADSLGFVCLKGDGMKDDELCFELPLTAGGVAHVYCDALFNVPDLPGFGGFMLRMMGSSGFFGTTWIGRLFMGPIGPWKAWLEGQAKRTDVAVIAVAHGDAIVANCGHQYSEAAARL